MAKKKKAVTYDKMTKAALIAALRKANFTIGRLEAKVAKLERSPRVPGGYAITEAKPAFPGTSATRWQDANKDAFPWQLDNPFDTGRRSAK